MTTPYQPSPYTPGHPPRRSAIPKVIGILMIIFGSLGILGGLIGLVMPTDPALAELPAWRDYERVTKLMGFVGFPISLFELIAGILLVKYKASGPKLGLVYGALAMLHTIANVGIVVGYAKPALDAALREAGGSMAAETMSAGMNIGLVFGTIIGLAWPILVLVLLSRPNAKAACVN